MRIQPGAFFGGGCLGVGFVHVEPLSLISMIWFARMHSFCRRFQEKYSISMACVYEKTFIFGQKTPGCMSNAPGLKPIAAQIGYKHFISN
jgi:hypothetical protein